MPRKPIKAQPTSQVESLQPTTEPTTEIASSASQGTRGRRTGKYPFLSDIRKCLMPEIDMSSEAYDIQVMQGMQKLALYINHGEIERNFAVKYVVEQIERYLDDGSITVWKDKSIGHLLYAVDTLNQLILPGYTNGFVSISEAGSFELDGWERMTDLYHTQLPPLQWCIEGLLPTGAGILVGNEGVGKSIFLLNLAVAIATETKALGAFTAKPGYVAYLALEDGRIRTGRRLQTIIPHIPYAEQAIENNRIHFKYSAPESNTNFKDIIKRWIDHVKEPSLIIIDVLAKLRLAQQEKDRGVYLNDYRMIGEIQELCKEYGITSLISHHTNKGMRRDNDEFSAVSGSRGLVGAADTRMILEKEAYGNEGTLTIKSRDFIECDKKLSLTLEDNFLWKYEGDAIKIKLSKERKEVIESIESFEGKKATLKQLQEEMDMTSKGGLCSIRTKNWEVGC